MASNIYRVEERQQSFEALLPKTGLTSRQNIEEALALISAAYSSFSKSGVKSSQMESTLKQMEKTPVLKATFGVYGAAKQLAYAVMLESEDEKRIFTLRVGSHFTELSLDKNGKLEIMREEKNQIIYEKIA